MVETFGTVGKEGGITDNILDYTDRVATGEDFGKTPSTEKYQNRGQYWDDGTEEERAIKDELWNAYRFAPAPERLQSYKKANDIYLRLRYAKDPNRKLTDEQAIDEAVDAGVELELSTILETSIHGSLVFNGFDNEEIDLIEQGLYDGNKLAEDLVRTRMFGFNDEEKTRSANQLMANVALRKQLFERVKSEKMAGFNKLGDEVPFAGNSQM